MLIIEKWVYNYHLVFECFFFGVSWEKVNGFMSMPKMDNGKDAKGFFVCLFVLGCALMWCCIWLFSMWFLNSLFVQEGDSVMAHFTYHKHPITSIEWSPHEASTLAVSSADNQLT